MTDELWDEWRYQVLTHRRATPVITELWLGPVEQPLAAYRPGQYALPSDTRYDLPSLVLHRERAPARTGNSACWSPASLAARSAPGCRTGSSRATRCW